MNHLLSLTSPHQQKTTPKLSEISPSVQQQLFSLYQSRLKSFMETVKIYQENLEKDNESGALAFMKTPEMATYRVDREFEMLKDVLLTQKQRLVIKVLTSFHQVKKQNDLLKSQSPQVTRTSFPKSQQEMAAEKDMHTNRASFEQESRVSARIGESNNQKNSTSRLSIISQANQITYSTNISVYEKLLQEKLTLIKELEKKNKQLTLENEQNLHKIAQLSTNLQKTLIQEMKFKPCVQCISLNETISKLKCRNEILVKQNESYQLKLKDEEGLKSASQNQLKLKELKLHELTMKLENLERENQLRRELQEQQKLTKPNPQTNTQTIKELKEKLIFQQQQLMSLNNSFEFLKQDISESLNAEVKRLKNSHQLLKQNLKSYILALKNQMLHLISEIIEAVRFRYQGMKTSEDITKKLRQIDNELDFFIEQKHIRT